MRAFVTGATGFVGSHLAELLVKEGVDVVAPVRNAGRLRWAAGLKAQIVETSLSDVERLKPLLAECDIVFHVAGLTKSALPAPFYRSNLLPTKTLAQAACLAGRPRRFVLVSSLAAAGSTTPDQPLREDAHCQPVTPYGWSKRRAEEALLRHRDQIEVVIVRPPYIYGPRDGESLLLFQISSSGLVIQPGDIDPLLSMVHVRDLVGGIWRLAQAPACRQTTYFLANPQPVRISEVFRLIAASAGRRPIEAPVPAALLDLAGWVGWAYGALTGHSHMLDRYKVLDLRQPAWVCDSSSIEAEHGIKAEIPLSEGIAETLRWYQEQGWL